jgi:hypothetical protein
MSSARIPPRLWRCRKASQSNALLVRLQLGRHRPGISPARAAPPGERGQRTDGLPPAIRLLDHVGELLEVAPRLAA